MNTASFNITGGWILGMLLVIAVQAAIIHQSEKHDMNWLDAVKNYLTKETGPIVVAVVMLFIALFLIPEIVANVAAEKTDGLGAYQRYLNSAVTWMRSWSIILGIASQTLGFVIVLRILKFIRKKATGGQNEAGTGN